MTQPHAGNFHNPVLSDASIAFANEATNFVAAQIVPMVGVGKDTGRYYVFDQEAFLRDDAQRIDGAQESSGGGTPLTTATFQIDAWSHHMDLSEDDRARFNNSGGGLDWRLTATKYVTEQMLIRREREIADMLFTAGNWDNSVTPSNLWSVAATSDPVGDVELGKRTVLLNTGRLPNTLAVGYDVDRYLRHHPQIRGRLGAENPENASQADVARALGVERYFVLSSVYASNNEGGTFSGAFVNGNDALLAYFPPSPGLMTPSAAYCFENDSLFMSGSMGIREIPLPHRNDAIRIEGKMAIGPTVTGSALGYHFEAVIS